MVRLNPFRRSEAKALKEMQHAPGNWSYRYLPRTSYDYAGNVDGRTNSAVQAVTSWIIRNFPEPPLGVWKPDQRGDLQEIVAHPMVQLIENPNPYFAGLLMQQATLSDWLFDGNAYQIKARSAAGRPAELWWVPQSLIQPKWPDGDPSVFISHYEYTPNGRPVNLAPEDVIHFRYGLDPSNPRKGLSPLRSILREVFSDDEASNFSAALLRNFGVPGLVLIPKGGDDATEITPDDADALSLKMDQDLGGDNRGRTRVLRDAFDLHTVGFNPQELDLKALHRLPEERISGIFGVAAIVAGLGAGLDRSTFANFAEAREAATEQNLVPTWRLFAAEYARQLLPDYGDAASLTVRYDTSKVRALQEDENAKSDRLVKQFQGGVTKRSEVRAALGLDTDQEDEVFALPVSVMLIGPGSPAFDSIPAEEEVQEEGAPARLERFRAASKASRRHQAIMTAFGRDRAKVSADFARDLGAAFEELGQDAARAYSSAKAMVPAGVDEKATDPTPEDIKIVLSITNSLDLDGWAEKNLGPIFTTYYQVTGELTYSSVAANLGVDLAWNINDPLAADVIAQGGTRLGLLDIPGDTTEALYRALGDARAAGMGPPDVAKLIGKYVPEGPYVNAGSEYRSLMIARTETHYAQNVASLAAYKESSVVTGVLAFDNQTGYGDEDCVARDGTVFTLEDAAAEIDHPNGTLNWAPVVGTPA